MRSTPAVLLALPILLVTVLASCDSSPRSSGGRQDRLRTAAPRTGETIFTAPDAPAPNSMRLASGVPGPDYWQQRASYAIDATLDADARRIEAVATIAYENHSPHQLDYIWLNLEQNLFRTDSEGTRATRPGTRFAKRAGFEGGYEIIAVRTPSGEDLQLHVHDTLGRLELSAPLEPRTGRLEFVIEYAFDVPEYGADRMGIDEVEQGTIFELAQWFPNVCVYDDVSGWNTLPYLGAGEFYTNYGDYDVRLTVPRDFIVSATGELQNPYDVLTETQRSRLNEAITSDETVMIITPDEVGTDSIRPPGDGPLTWHFRAGDVRTVAWACSDAFIWDACGVDDTRGGRVQVQSMYPKEATAWAESTQMLRTAIDGYNQRWFPYPYPVATNVNGVAGGMEYPMIIFCGARENDKWLYGVTTHEIGHNWFPMLVNTDERRHAWMDEGLNTFINYYSWQEWFPGDEPRRGNPARFVERDPRELWQPATTQPDRVGRRMLGRLAYEKPAVGLVMLREQILGPERFDAAFRQYIRQWAFKSPQPSDFFRCMEDAAGVDLSWFWRGWFYETGVLDQAIRRVKANTEDGTVEVTFENKEDLVMPVLYRVTYSDGTTEDRRLPVAVWSTTNVWTTAWALDGRWVKSIEIDADGGFPDVDRRNNKWGG